MSTKDFQFNRVTSCPYQVGSDPTRLYETDPESDPVWVRIADPNGFGSFESRVNARPSITVWVRIPLDPSRVNGAHVTSKPLSIKWFCKVANLIIVKMSTFRQFFPHSIVVLVLRIYLLMSVLSYESISICRIMKLLQYF